MSAKLTDFVKRFRHSNINAITESKPLTSEDGQFWGVVPDVPYAKLFESYISNGGYKAAIDNMAAQIVGSGFYFTSDKHDQAALKPAYDWAERVAFVEWLQYLNIEILAAGWSLLTPPDGNTWANIDYMPDYMVQLTSVKQIDVTRDPITKMVVKRELVQDFGNNIPQTKTDMKDLLEFKWGGINRRYYGVGILHPLHKTRVDIDGRTVPALADMQATWENDMVRFMHNKVPRFLWNFNIGDKDYKEKVLDGIFKGGKLQADSDILTNWTKEKVDFRALSIADKADFKPIVDYLTNMSFLALQSPLPKLFTTTGFTEASARAALEVAAAYRYVMQSFEKRTINQKILKYVAIGLGLKDLKLEFGQLKRFMPTSEDAHRMAQLGGLTMREYRENMKRTAGIWLETETDTVPINLIQPPQNQNKASNYDSKALPTEAVVTEADKLMYERRKQNLKNAILERLENELATEVK